MLIKPEVVRIIVVSAQHILPKKKRELWRGAHGLPRRNQPCKGVTPSCSSKFAALALPLHAMYRGKSKCALIKTRTPFSGSKLQITEPTSLWEMTQLGTRPDIRL
jgi:hypothetical protein